MRRGDEEAGDEIVVARLHPRPALAAARLLPVGRERHALDVAAVRDGDDHVLAGDQILVVDAVDGIEDLAAARGVANAVFTAIISSLTMPKRRSREPQDVEVVGDLGGEAVQRLGDLVAAERGEAGQAQLENAARLFFRQAVLAVLIERVPRDRRSA